jgi:hypothetical protein
VSQDSADAVDYCGSVMGYSEWYYTKNLPQTLFYEQVR